MIRLTHCQTKLPRPMPMPTKMNIALIISLVLILPQLVLSSTYSPTAYPNPTKTGYKECNLKSIGNICDVGEVLSFSDRYRLDYELRKMNERSAGSGGNHCSISGIKAILVIDSDVNQNFADQLNKLYNLDGQCKKSVVFLLDSSTNKLFYATESDTGVDTNQFAAIISGARSELQSGEYAKALVNIFKQIGGNGNRQATQDVPSSNTNQKPNIQPTSKSNSLVPPGSKREKILNALGGLFNKIQGGRK
uniref:TPM_phosphatase domain-containing protein n=1 Tax=Rhabditophanes sp. KR3021 TaxID=114890 RepID=A0AC35UGL9_9BILA